MSDACALVAVRYGQSGMRYVFGIATVVRVMALHDVMSKRTLPMKSLTRFSSLAVGLSVVLASSVGAQSLATFGSAEVGGFGEGSALLGTSLSTGRQGLGPIAGLVGQTYRYHDTQTSHAQAYAISPSVGLQYAMPTGAVSASVGYTFVNTQFDRVISGGELGGTNGVFVSAQGNYWGTGENTAQVIGSYGFKSEYYWSRLRAAHRLAPSANPIYLGGEFVLQGTQQGYIVNSASGLRGPSQTRYEVGPTIEYRVSPEFRIGASGGLRGGNNSTPQSGYARVEFLLLTKLAGM